MLPLGGNGQTGDLTLLDESNRQRLFARAKGSRPFLRFEDKLGVIQILLEGDTGNIFIKGKLNVGGVDLSGANIQTLLQTIQTISSLAQQIQNLENRNQELTQQVNLLQGSVSDLFGIVNSLQSQISILQSLSHPLGT